MCSEHIEPSSSVQTWSWRVGDPETWGYKLQSLVLGLCSCLTVFSLGTLCCCGQLELDYLLVFNPVVVVVSLASPWRACNSVGNWMSAYLQDLFKNTVMKTVRSVNLEPLNPSVLRLLSHSILNLDEVGQVASKRVNRLVASLGWNLLWRSNTGIGGHMILIPDCVNARSHTHTHSHDYIKP